MVRQARSEATRRKIIDSAVDLINEIGYPAAGLGDIIERAELTKGALYYHFDSKEALATAIIEEGSETLLTAFRAAGRTGAPTMENIIHGSFVMTDVLSLDR
nr:TetR/AcrR family transcriptional regulator [Actinomycetota bacterium]